MRVVDFELVRTATQDASEEAHLVRFNQHIVAVLLPAETGWFLQMGFGPCEQEGLVFQSLTAAESWVRACLQGGAASGLAKAIRYRGADARARRRPVRPL